MQHKQAKKLDVPVLNRTDLPGLIRVMQTSPNAHVKETAWRLAQENYASDPRLAQIKQPDGEQGARALRAGARRDDGRAAQGGARLVRGRDRQLDPIGARRRGHRAGARPTWQRRLTYSRPQALTDFVVAVLPAALPAQRRPDC